MKKGLSLDRGSRWRSLLAVMGRVNWLGLGFILLLLFIWEFTVRTGTVDMFGLVAPSTVSSTLITVFTDGTMAQHLPASLWRLFAGYAVASVVGIVVGTAMGMSGVIDRTLEPVVEFLRPIPSPAYVPIAILFFGIDDAMKIVVVAFGAVFPIVVNTYSGVKGVDVVQLNTARTLGASRRQTIFRVILPAASPYIMAGLRISLAVSLILVVIAEMIASNSGIGFYILDRQRFFRVAEMYAGIVSLGALGYALNRVFVLLERRMLHWHTHVSQ